MKVLVLKEKHGKDYFAVPMNKDGDVMLHVIKERHADGWYEGSLVDEKEEKLLAECLENNFKSAIKFFELRRNAEYEGWDLIEAKVLSLPDHAVAHVPLLPLQCRARFEEIGARAERLLDMFVMGNRKDTVEELEVMEPRAALAVLANMMMFDPAQREDLQNFLTEVA